MQTEKIIRSNRKTLSLTVDNQGQLIVRAPHQLSINHIKKFVKQKSNWILKKQNYITDIIKAQHENAEYKDGKIIFYLGRKYHLRLNGKIKQLKFEEKYIEFPYKYLDNAEAYMVKWYKIKAKEIISLRIEKYALSLNLKYNKIGITSAKKRWGSCNTNGNINFSYRLIMAPIDVIDYVIIHELMHLIEPNHSENFWKQVESIMPDYKIRKKWLRDNQYRILYS